MIEFGNQLILGLVLLAAPALYLAFTREERVKKITAGLKALSIILVAVALASPSITVEEERNKEDRLIILEDKSRSTDIFEDAELDMDGVQIERRTVSTGTSSDLSSGILRNVDDDTSYLLISDLQSDDSLENLPERVNDRNSSIDLLKPETRDESSIRIEGPDTTYPGAENSFEVKLSSTAETKPEPEIILNGEEIEAEKAGNNTWSFSETFTEEGIKEIRASIQSDDIFPDNNNYYKTVEVAEKPEILVLGDEGRISQEFDDFYSFEHRNEIPEDLSPYYTVIAKQEFEEESIADYIAEGNGLIYTGELEEENRVLPVRKSEYEDTGIEMMLLIDASQGTGGECIEGSEDFCLEREDEGGALEKTQEISYLLLDSETLPEGSKVGALYYNSQPTLISKPKPLGENNHREKLQGGITNIPTGGNSLHHRAIRAGQEVIDGEGNLMLITDGKITGLGEFNNETRNSRELAESSEQKIISVMVGEDSNENYLQEISSLSGGYTISDAKAQEIKFQGGGASSDAVSLIKNTNSHFITNGIDIESSTTGFTGSEPKGGARQLVSGTNSQPFLTTWRYGIGRVAAYTGGEKDLGATMYQDSELVSRSLSWATGDPTRKEDENMDITGRQLGETVEVSANYPVEGLRRQGENLYTGELNTSSAGFHSFNQKVYSYNYNDEVEEVGFSNSENIALETGGKVFTPEQKDQITESVQEFNSEKVSKQNDITEIFLATALIVILTEIGYRKRRGKK